MGSSTKKTKAQKKADREALRDKEWLEWQQQHGHNHLMFPVDHAKVDGMWQPICDRCTPPDLGVHVVEETALEERLS